MPREIAVVSVSEVWERRDLFAGSLAPAEREVFGELEVDKRKKDWLAGRIAAKRAVQKKLGLPFGSIEIIVEESGRPRFREWYLSITHSGDVAAAIASTEPIGLDVEQIAPRDASFERLVLTANDRARLDGLSGPSRDEQLTRLWCEKESYAKLDGNGLRIPFAELIVPSHVRTETGRFDFGDAAFAFAISSAA